MQAAAGESKAQASKHKGAGADPKNSADTREVCIWSMALPPSGHNHTAALKGKGKGPHQDPEVQGLFKIDSTELN